MLEVVIIFSAFCGYILGMFKLLTTLGPEFLLTKSGIFRTN